MYTHNCDSHNFNKLRKLKIKYPAIKFENFEKDTLENIYLNFYLIQIFFFFVKQFVKKYKTKVSLHAKRNIYPLKSNSHIFVISESIVNGDKLRLSDHIIVLYSRVKYIFGSFYRNYFLIDDLLTHLPIILSLVWHMFGSIEIERNKAAGKLKSAIQTGIDF